MSLSCSSATLGDITSAASRRTAPIHISQRWVSSHRTTSAQRGFLSLEAGLVLLVVALAIVAAVIYYRDNLRRTSINTNVTQMLATAGAARSTFGQANRYADVTTAIAVSANVIPSTLRSGTDQAATNIFGGTIEAAPAQLTTAADVLRIEWPNVPAGQCIEIAMGIQGELRRLDIAGTTVKPTDAPLNLATTTTACESAGTVEIAMFVGRN
jgi:hypothetical protein